MPKFIVEGVYEEENQVTGDVVVADTEDQATKMVTEVREVSSSDPWTHDRTISMLNEIKHLQDLEQQSDETVIQDWNDLIKDMYVEFCCNCKKPQLTYNLEDGRCQPCMEKRDEDIRAAEEEEQECIEAGDIGPD